MDSTIAYASGFLLLYYSTNEHRRTKHNFCDSQNILNRLFCCIRHGLKSREAFLRFRNMRCQWWSFKCCDISPTHAFTKNSRPMEFLFVSKAYIMDMGLGSLRRISKLPSSSGDSGSHRVSGSNWYVNNVLPVSTATLLRYCYVSVRKETKSSSLTNGKIYMMP